MVSRLLVACVFAACLSLTHARLLRQTGSTFDFSYSNNTYIGSVTLVGSGTYTNSAEACIQGCVDDADCVYWSWCPADQASGCAVPGLNGASDTTVAAKGCVLSYDSDKNRNAVFVMSGDSVTFAGGKWNPSNYVPTPSSPGAPPPPPPTQATQPPGSTRLARPPSAMAGSAATSGAATRSSAMFATPSTSSSATLTPT